MIQNKNIGLRVTDLSGTVDVDQYVNGIGLYVSYNDYSYMDKLIDYLYQADLCDRYYRRPSYPNSIMKIEVFVKYPGQVFIHEDVLKSIKEIVNKVDKLCLE